jgi:DNA-binding CsgD family transcriptional regulator
VNEVSGRATMMMIDLGERRGIPAERLLAGISATASSLRMRGARIDWDDYALIVDRLEEEIGGPAAFIELTEGAFDVLPEVAFLAGMFFSPVDLCRFVSLAFALPQYGIVRCSMEELGDGRYVLQAGIPLPYRGSSAFMRATLGTLRAQPRLLGLPSASVDAEFTEREGRWVVTPPRPTAGARRARSFARDVLARAGVMIEDVLMLRGVDTQERVEREQVERVLMEGRSRVHSAARGDAAAGFVSALVDNTTCRAASVWKASPDGTLAAIHRAGEAGIEPTIRHELLHDGNFVGAVDVDADPWSSDAFAVWLRAVAAAVAEAEEPEVGNERHLEEVSNTLGLTRHQRSVLWHLSRGLSNKQIAAALGCQESTVEFHLTNVMRKARVTSRSELVARVWRDRVRR